MKRKRDVQKEGDIGMANGNVRTKKEERICIVFDSFGGEGLGREGAGFCYKNRLFRFKKRERGI